MDKEADANGLNFSQPDPFLFIIQIKMPGLLVGFVKQKEEEKMCQRQKI